jgi:hypothetical protein
MSKQDDFDAKVRDLWRRLNLDELADVADLTEKPIKKAREEIDEEVIQAWILKNLK